MTKREIGMNGTYSMDCDLAEEIAIVDRLEYGWIELRDWKVADYLKSHDLSELCSLLSQASVAPLAVNTIEPITLSPGADRQRLTESAQWRLRIAAATGCPAVVACCWGTPDGISAEDGKRQVVEGLKLVSDIAAEHGVKIAYEPLGSKTSPVHTIADTMDVLREVDRENIGWLFDVYHFHVADGSLEALAASDAGKLLLVHMNDVKDLPYDQLAVPSSERLLPGDGASALPEIVSTLFQIGYRGPFSIELYNKEFLSWDPYEFAKVAKEKTEAILGQCFKSQVAGAVAATRPG